jgi:hypothetical protein
LRVGAVLLAAAALAGCGRLNRTATLNQVHLTSGAATAIVLQQQLAKLGHPSVHVSCAKTMIVEVGTSTSCTVTGVGPKGIVRFTFSKPSGAVDPASVKAS